MKPLASIAFATTSATKIALLNRLALQFFALDSHVDESLMTMSCGFKNLAIQLAQSKALTVAQKYPQYCVIGADQVAVCNNIQLHKPYTEQNAFNQLTLMCDKTCYFYTAYVIVNGQQLLSTHVQTVTIKMCVSNDDEIWRYIKIDQPLHCAGSFKCESLGLSLFDELICDDVTGLMGLPLLALCKYLRKLGYLLP